MLEPASTVIKICGGFDKTAEMSGRTSIQVRRWAYPRDRNGSDGMIPSAAAQTLLTEAKKRGIDLRPEHFFLEDEQIQSLPKGK